MAETVSMIPTTETPYEIFQTRAGKIYLDSDGIIRATTLPGAELTFQDAVESFEVVKQLCGDRKRPLLADIRPIRNADKGNREYSARPEHAAYVAATAVLTDSTITRILINLFLSVNQPAYPTRMFREEAEALEWLRQYL